MQRKNKRNYLLSTTLLFLCFAFCQNAHAALRTLIIDGGKVDGVPIAVVPFQHEGQPAETTDIAEIVRKDLQTSGQFKILAKENTRQSPARQSEVQYPYWQSLKIEDLVVGRIQKTAPDNYTVYFELLDVLRQKEGALHLPLLAVKFDNIKPQQFRALAHHISDRIFQKIIGVRGFFSTRIAYVSVLGKGRNAQRFLEVADYDGANPKTLFRSQYPIMSPAWSPDCKKLAFVSFEKERSSIMVADVSTGHVERVTQFPGLNSAPAWSPDGRTLALVLSKDGCPKIYTINFQNRKISQLTTGSGIDTEPFWAADGQSIVFTSDRGGKPQIYRVTLNTGKIDRLTFQGVYNAKPSLTPDGKNLVTLHRGADGLFCIAVHQLGTGTVRVLSQTGLNDSPSLAPNGMMVLYGSQEAGQGVLAAVTLDGQLKIRLPAREGNVQEPAWSPFPLNNI